MAMAPHLSPANPDRSEGRHAGPADIGHWDYDIAIVGTVGLPPNYGGFETLAGRLVEHWGGRRRVIVYCSAPDLPATTAPQARYLDADLAYVNLRANGWQSIPYDAVCLFRAARHAQAILLLGVSGAIVLPLLRLLHPSVRIVTNIDGLEWRRAKWGWFSRRFLKFSERIAVRASHMVVADNRAIADHIAAAYGASSACIPYGGDFDPEDTSRAVAPSPYFLMLCRIEPENNVEAILTAFAASPRMRLVAVGNWQHSPYARQLRERFGTVPNCEMRDPVYDRTVVARLRREATAYVHGHSAGGTNPALVEAMALGCAVLAYDVSYNRHTTDNQASYWRDDADLRSLLATQDAGALAANGNRMAYIARERYRWPDIALAYESLLT